MSARTRDVIAIVSGGLAIISVLYAWLLWQKGPTGSGAVMVHAVRMYTWALVSGLVFGAIFLLFVGTPRKK